MCMYRSTLGAAREHAVPSDRHIFDYLLKHVMVHAGTSFSRRFFAARSTITLCRQQRTLMGALITIDVHARDVVRYMVKSEVCSVTDFEWTKQLRYYWEVTD